MPLQVSNRIKEKLSQKHGVRVEEVEDCFSNREKGFLEDDREDHKTNPPTLWFVAETDYGRILKIVFIEKDNTIFLKTAYEPNSKEIDMYERLAG